jgi:hypothetical protein
MEQYQRLLQEQKDAEAARDAAYTPPDTSALQARGVERGRQGGQNLLMALAAQEAGKEFAPMNAHFLKQASALQAPEKVTGGMITDKGFVEDPTYKQNLAIQRADAKVTQIERALQGNLTQQERARLESEKIAAQAQRDRERAEDRKDIVRLGAALKGPAPVLPKGTFEGYAADTGEEVVRDKQGVAHVRTGFDAAGNPQYKPHQGAVLPKGTYEKNVADATTLAQSADTSANLLTKIENSNAFGLGQSLASRVPGVLGKSFLQDVAGMSESDKALRANFASQAAAEMSRLYGAAQSQGEASRAAEFLINKDDSVETVMTKLKGGMDYAREAQARWGSAVNKGVQARTGIGAAPAPAKAPPKIGEVRNGFTYQGGDPASPSSWSK